MTGRVEHDEGGAIFRFCSDVHGIDVKCRSNAEVSHILTSFFSCFEPRDTSGVLLSWSAARGDGWILPLTLPRVR